MPIGIVSDEELEKELSNLADKKSGETKKESHKSDSVVIGEIIPGRVTPKPTRGRDEGDVNVPDSLRKIIAEDALLNGRQSALNLAASFGISPSSVSAYTKGATSTTSYNNPSSSIIQHINKSRERAVKRASKTLNSALSAITQEKLDYAEAKDLSGIAKDMSVIIKNLEPQQVADNSQPTSPQFVIFAPQFRQENTFETITVQE